ncbi:MAG: AAA family ATPase [Clostridiaceae bacterium]|nr:AAA family ATPase [Clostridiaceae bacterium]
MKPKIIIQRTLSSGDAGEIAGSSTAMPDPLEKITEYEQKLYQGTDEVKNNKLLTPIQDNINLESKGAGDKMNKKIDCNIYGEGNESFKENFHGETTSLSLTVDDFLGKSFPERKMIFDPWLRQGTICLVYAKRGCGKSWFSLSLAVAATRGLEIANWKTINPVGCLYLDGEMACDELQSRLKKLTSGHSFPLAPLNIVSSEYMKSKNKPTIDLTNEKCRKDILKSLKENKNFGLLVIDNLSCLTPRISENSKASWDDINQWLLELRADGIAVILVHHTGKDGKQRGTSAREDNIDISISLTEAYDYPSKGGAKFIVGFDKLRAVHRNDLPPFSMEIMKGEEGILPWNTTLRNDVCRNIFDGDSFH